MIRAKWYTKKRALISGTQVIVLHGVSTYEQSVMAGAWLRATSAYCMHKGLHTADSSVFEHALQKMGGTQLHRVGVGVCLLYA